jgi:imidazolonepropionase-like amidohydrolase
VDETVDAVDRLVTPGLISTHAHIAGSPLDRSFIEDRGPSIKNLVYVAGLTLVDGSSLAQIDGLEPNFAPIVAGHEQVHEGARMIAGDTAMAMTDNTVRELSREEILTILEAGARRRLGVTAQAMLCAYRHGQLDDPGAVADLLVLADLLPPDEPALAD